MDALEKFMQYTQYVRKLSSVLGMDVLGAGYRLGPLTYFTFILLTIYAIISVNSVLVADDSTEILKALSFAGLFFQFVFKIYYTLSRAEQYHQTHTILKESIYLMHLDGTERQKGVILKNVSLLLLLVKGTTFLYMSSVVLFSIYPAYMYFVVEVKVPMLPLFVPGISIHSAYGYGLTNLIHGNLAIFAVCGALSSDTGFMMFVFHIVTYADLLSVQLDTFAEKLYSIEKKFDLKDYNAYCRIQMREIYLCHKGIIEYLETLKALYENISIAQVVSCTITISLNLFLALMTDWYATYGFLLVSTFQLFIYAVLGTIIQLMNDRIVRLVYDMPWHLLPNSERRSFQFLLFKTQLPIELFIRGLGPLNVETFTEIMRMIYSSFTMLYSFLTEQ